MQNERRKIGRMSLVLGLVLCCALALSAGCASKQQKTAKKSASPLPVVPAKQPMAIDTALREQARQEIMTAAESKDPVIRAHAMESIRNTMGPEASEVIVKHLTDDDALVRFAASLAAGELRLKDAKPALLVLSDDADPSVRIGAKFALHRIGDTRQSHDLEKTSRDPQPRTRGDTALVLGLLGEPSARRILIPMLSDRSPAVRQQAAEALWRLGNDQGLDTLLAASIMQYPDDQMIALLALASGKDRKVLGHVEGSLAADYPEVSLVAARGAGMLGSDAGYGVAMKYVKSSEPRQRALAALALGAIGRSDAQPTLAAMLKDVDADTRLAAATAILQLKAA